MIDERCRTPRRRRFTVAEYAGMGTAGILRPDDRVELINGAIIEMPPMGPSHAAIVNELAAALWKLVEGKAHVRVQTPVRLSPDSEPEPDLALVSARSRRFAYRHPAPRDILLVIEVADSSLAFDRDEKMPLYAAAGISEAWLVDVGARTITVYTAPSAKGYGESRPLGWRDEVASSAVRGLAVTFESILPLSCME